MHYEQLIRDGQKLVQHIKFIPRAYVFPEELLRLQKIISFVGARRVGKSTMMKQVIHTLVAKKLLQREQIVWIDGNEVNPLQFDVQKLLEAYLRLFPKQRPFFIIDEVHELPDRVRQLFVLYNKGYHIFISGSNAHLLSSEISTKLRGKVYDQRIYGLNWSEYMTFVGFTFDHSTESNALREHHFHHYLHFGGFPEVALANSLEIKAGLLQNYFDVLLYKDLIERYSIDKEFVVKYLIKYLSTTVTKAYSVKNFINQLKSQGVSITPPTVYNYLEYLQNIFFVSPLRQLGRQRGSVKYYVHDNGYLGLRNKEDWGKKLENLIVQWYQRQSHDLVYANTSAGEIDICSDTQAIQVCRYLTGENLARETNSLLDCTKGQRQLIYMHADTNLQLPKGITYTPVWDIL